MTSMYAVVAVLATALVGSTVAVARCDLGIVAKLKTTPECYTGGKAPKLTGSGNLGTHVRISKGHLPADTKCVTAVGHAGGADVNIYEKNGGKISYSVKQEPKDGYLLETDPTGKIFPIDAKYRLYVIHNEANVYSYYRCTEGTKGETGIPMGDIAVGCKNTKDPKSVAVIDKAMKCFAALGINNVEHLDPCTC